MTLMSKSHHRKIRSFVRRPGRMTPAQRRALTELMPRWGLQYQDRPIDLGPVFDRDAPLVLDIGFGDGEALLTLSVNNPSIDYLGVEVHEPGIGHLLLLLERAGATNVRVIQRDATEVLDQMLPDAELDAVNLFFPDPWPKKRHHKRRLLDPGFLDLLAGSLKPNGLLHVATDWGDYANQILTSVDNNPSLINQAGVGHFSERPAHRSQTKYEMRGLRLGHTVNDIVARRNP